LTLNPANKGDHWLAFMAPSRMWRRMNWVGPVGLCSMLSIAVAGCGAAWEGADGRHHFLGFGHVSWTAGRTGNDTVVVGTDVVGVAIRMAGENAGLAVGYSSDRIIRLGDDTMVELTCLTCDWGSKDARITEYDKRRSQ
jgi:Na+-transporting NADH:ubiquinone oxidoreductase subunit NqrB